MKRCVNLDWFEVFCDECIDAPRDAEYFRHRGYSVEIRAYGTPQYREMFTLYIDNFPYLEIRRNPYSLKKEGGIFKENACHLRLSNRACYDESPIKNLCRFLSVHKYTFVSVSRVDICNDFVKFDNGVNPSKMISSYLKGNVSKIGLSRLSAHGEDRFYDRLFNSIAWGSPSSAISVKLYNKSLELKERKDKFYIRDAWDEAGFSSSSVVYRVEFSIKSDIKVFVNEDGDKFFFNVLETYETRDRLLCLFMCLSKIYFHFKRVVYTRDGKRQRKDRCPDIWYFSRYPDEDSVKPRRLTTDKEPNRIDKILINKLKGLIEDIDTPNMPKSAAKELLCYMVDMYRIRGQDEYLNKLESLLKYGKIND